MPHPHPRNRLLSDERKTTHSNENTVLIRAPKIEIGQSGPDSQHWQPPSPPAHPRSPSAPNPPHTTEIAVFQTSQNEPFKRKPSVNLTPKIAKGRPDPNSQHWQSPSPPAHPRSPSAPNPPHTPEIAVFQTRFCYPPSTY